ncbi:hypothetical protein RF11_03326 [Thelohanellus kitauei]|uniref:Uncharacterized protein n=1 Tax=Thelohanellus kitauei TaxID=669202 RepID=A0A0C2IGX3_THEKT|nr:hypothetical protein RF11_03326 [Thelohanellus kitauei]
MIPFKVSIAPETALQQNQGASEVVKIMVPRATLSELGAAEPTEPENRESSRQKRRWLLDATSLGALSPPQALINRYHEIIQLLRKYDSSNSLTESDLAIFLNVLAEMYSCSSHGICSRRIGIILKEMANIGHLKSFLSQPAVNMIFREGQAGKEEKNSKISGRLLTMAQYTLAGKPRGDRQKEASLNDSFLGRKASLCDLKGDMRNDGDATLPLKKNSLMDTVNITIRVVARGQPMSGRGLYIVCIHIDTPLVPEPKAQSYLPPSGRTAANPCKDTSNLDFATDP